MSAAFADPAAAPSNAADATTRLTRALCLAALIALILLGLAWELGLAPTGRGTLALKVLPLAFTVLGVWRCRMRTYRVLSLLVWLYVAEGLVRAFTEKGLSAGLAVAETVLALLLFAGCVWHVRWRLRRVDPS